ncbi:MULTISPECIES: undecaprenyl-phosphate glucose phosphotransferase [unclassified Polaromonas]|uniref:undecaprenyl-phosphate glucose phosphotransferase n=1 Tax=unclassified Polaromonas TaxID=2638319 RepID=UPI000F08A685|nr:MULTISPECIES: undecaprenyl-phosphate glucose phosphotransferase [unclassified Polaromonas]AYQ30200.1 undecaprenyl-phosphate glucose phosphotransferase [Polaromonas sp. SP1]QGJ18684.1 undecaprenyl-phosphate glucose phosphotransferase [Polaromonas sp. Pch-P]
MAEANPLNSASAWLNQREPRSMGLGRSHLFTAVEAGLDPLVLVFSLWGLAFYYEGSVRPAYLILSLIVFSLTFPGSSQLRLPVWKVLFKIAFHWIWIAGLLLLTGYVTEYFHKFSMAVLGHWLWVAPLAQIGAHLALRAAAPQLLKLQGPPRGAVIVGMNEQGVSLAGHIAGSAYSGIDLKGFFDDRGEERRTAQDGQDGHRLIGKIDDLPAYVKQHRIQFIYLSLPMASRPRILQVLDGLKDTTASIYFVPDMFITDLIQGRSDTVCGVTVISVCDTPFRGAHGVLKRASDIVLSLLILLLILPVMAVIALMVKLDSPGPVIFKQRRYGLDGEEILVYKFRSMAVTEDGGTIRQASKNDMRVTRLGAILRKTSLDELPQFFNVLQGRMSIVGPRPHAVAHNEMYRSLIKGYMVRHKVRPGITGWAQVNGQRGETDTLDKMQSRIDCDLDYLRNWSLQLDFFIILKTIRLVFKDGAAY